MTRYLSLSLLAFLLTNFINSQEVEFIPDDWENPAVFEKGQNLPHAFHVPFASKEAANTILNVDYEVSGVGGTAIRQLQKYRGRPGVKKCQLTIRSFSSN